MILFGCCPSSCLIITSTVLLVVALATGIAAAEIGDSGLESGTDLFRDLPSDTFTLERGSAFYCFVIGLALTAILTATSLVATLLHTKQGKYAQIGSA